MSIGNIIGSTATSIFNKSFNDTLIKKPKQNQSNKPQTNKQKPQQVSALEFS